VQVSHSNCAGCHCLNRALTVPPIKRAPPPENRRLFRLARMTSRVQLS